MPDDIRPPIPASLAHRPVRGGLASAWVNAELADGGVSASMGDVKTVPLGGSKARGRMAIVDAEDYALVGWRSWHVWEYEKEGWRAGPYAKTQVRREGRPVIVSMHALITGWPETDHINHNGLDNRRANLRPATRGQNNVNTRSRIGSSSPYKGVSRSLRLNAWCAQIKGRGHLGYFDSDIDAARTYDTIARELYGEYAFLNFPELPPLTQEEISSLRRRGTGGIIRGLANHNSKLTESAVREIRLRSANGESGNSLAKYFTVSPVAISQVLTGKTWRHVA